MKVDESEWWHIQQPAWDEPAERDHDPGVPLDAVDEAAEALPGKVFGLPDLDAELACLCYRRGGDGAQAASGGPVRAAHQCEHRVSARRELLERLDRETVACEE